MNDQEKDKLFGKIGIDLGFFTLADITQALENQKVDEVIGTKKPIGAYLFEAKIISREQIASILKNQAKYEKNETVTGNSVLHPTTVVKKASNIVIKPQPQPKISTIPKQIPSVKFSKTYVFGLVIFGVIFLSFGVYFTRADDFKSNLKAAQQGDANAQNALGMIYDSGKVVPRDVKEAAKWYLKAAEQGNATAQCNIGIMYDTGDGVPKDEKEAYKWYLKAADQGNARAQFNVGATFFRNKEEKEAAKWFLKAADQGHLMAQCNIGAMYYQGVGVPQDDKEAVKWFAKAAEQGYTVAQYELALMYCEGRGVPQDDKEAVKWYLKAAEQGFAKAQNNLGLMYSDGKGVVQDFKEASKWFAKAAEQGLDRAKDNLEIAQKKSQEIEDCLQNEKQEKEKQEITNETPAGANKEPTTQVESSDASVELVKRGVLKLDSSVTVGDALDGYKFFGQKNWESFQDSQKRQIVEFNGVMDYEKYAGTSKPEMPGVTVTADMVRKAKQDLGDLTLTYKIQFAISKDGTSFEMKYSAIKVSGTKRFGEGAGQKVEQDIPDDKLSMIKEIYANKPETSTWGLILAASSKQN